MSKSLNYRYVSLKQLFYYTLCTSVKANKSIVLIGDIKYTPPKIVENAIQTFQFNEGNVGTIIKANSTPTSAYL